MSLPAFSATKLIYQAYRDIGGARPGPTSILGTDMLNDCLDALNQVIDGLLLDEMMVFARLQETFNLVINTQSYTIGPGATFNTVRPTRIQDASVILNNVTPNVRVALECINVDEFASIPVPVLGNGLPSKLYYARDFTSANGWGTIALWPGALYAYQLEIFTWQQLQQFADLATTYIFPPGYPRMLRKLLALEIAPMMKIYFKIPDPLLSEVAEQAADAVNKVRSYNAAAPKMACDPAMVGELGRGGFNWLSGLSGRGTS